MSIEHDYESISMAQARAQGNTMSAHQSILKSVVIGLLSAFAGCGGSQQNVTGAPASSEGPEPTPTETEVVPDEPDAAEQEPDPQYGKFVRIDLITSQPEKAAAFYEKLLGWTITPVPVEQLAGFRSS
jgi:hypothetical protein